MVNTIQTVRNNGGILGAIDQIARKNYGNCQRCGKPRGGILRAVGQFKGRGDFSPGGSTYTPARMETRKEAGLCSCQEAP